MAVYTETNKGVMSGNTELVLVPSPIRGMNIVTMLRVINTDTANATMKIRIKDPGRVGESDEYPRIVNDITLEPDEYMQIDGVVSTLSGPQHLVVELAENATTTEPDWMAVWGRELIL